MGNCVSRLFGAMFVLLAALAAIASPGDLDASFGSGGVARVTVGSSSDAVAAIATQSDGKTIAAGSAASTDGGSGAPSFLALARYGTDGKLDSSFGNAGKVVTAIGPFGAAASSVLVQPDGKIVAAGRYGSSATTSEVAIVRYNTDGMTDASFGVNGIVQWSPADSTTSTAAVATVLQADGKLLVAVAFPTPSYAYRLIRLNSDGTIDTSFGDGGIVTTGIASSGLFVAQKSLVLQGDQRILFSSGSTIARYLANGSLDMTFGPGTGTVSAQLGQGGSFSALALQSDGRIVAAGSVERPASPFFGTPVSFLLARYLPDGNVDASFGNQGIVTTSFSSLSVDRIATVCAQPDGTIIAGGTTTVGSALARYMADGSLDASFGQSGLVTHPWQLYLHAVTEAICLPGGGLVAGERHDGTATPDFAAVKYDSAGNLDATFGDSGIASTDVMFGTIPHLTSVTTSPNGRVIAVGDDGNGRMAAVALVPNGQFDPTFGNAGRVDLTADTKEGKAMAEALQVDGKLILAGGDSQGFKAARLNADGSLDPSFGGMGFVAAASSSSSGVTGQFRSVAQQPDGKIIAVGSNATNATIRVARYLPNGLLDNSFGQNGILNTQLGALSGAEGVAVSLLADGRLLVAGNEYNALNQGTFSLVLYNPDGTADATFGTAGIVKGPMKGVASALTVQPDGSAIVVGTSTGANGLNAIGIARYLSNGSVDPSFGSGRQVTVQVGGRASSAAAVALDAGRILLAGQASDPANASASNFVLVRLNPDGSLDPTFGSGGIVVAPTGPGTDKATGLALQADGAILLVGQHQYGSSVLRFINSVSRPDAFAFSPVSALAGRSAQSESLTVTGLSAPTPIVVSGGEYSIGCNGAFTSAMGFLQPGDAICVRRTTAAIPGAQTTTMVTIGGIAGTFTTTALAGSTPDIQITSSTTASNIGDNVTFTATVSTATGVSPTGSVTFYDNRTLPPTALATASLANGRVSYTTNMLQIGRHSISAAYLGDSNFLSVSTAGSVAVDVNAGPSASTLPYILFNEADE